MDLALVIKYRLGELGLDQKDLAAAAQVTESYISQLLARKKAPPSADRTEIYARISRFLKLPEDELSKLADIQRREKLKEKVGEPLRPLHGDCRELILSKCVSVRRREVRIIFEKEPFGELERLVTQKFLDIAKVMARDQLQDVGRLPLMAALDGRTAEQIRQANLDFLAADVFDMSDEICVLFLEPLIESWDIDLRSFAVDVFLNPQLVAGGRRRFEFVETERQQPVAIEPGLQDFLADQSISGDVTQEELEFLSALKFGARRPTPIYYYRELQNFRDPLHFRNSAQKKEPD